MGLHLPASHSVDQNAFKAGNHYNKLTQSAQIRVCHIFI